MSAELAHQLFVRECRAAAGGKDARTCGGEAVTWRCLHIAPCHWPPHVRCAVQGYGARGPPAGGSPPPQLVFAGDGCRLMLLSMRRLVRGLAGSQRRGLHAAAMPPSWALLPAKLLPMPCLAKVPALMQ